MTATGLSGDRPTFTIGRDKELTEVSAWLTDPTAPHVLALTGEPGIGKTTVWLAALADARAAGWTVLSCRAAPGDRALGFAALADLLDTASDDHLAELPPLQRRALEVTLLRRAIDGGDLEPRLVGTAVVALLHAFARRAPLLLAVDDLQWVDVASARALAFALGRHETVRLLVTVRTEDPPTASILPADGWRSFEAALGTSAIARLEIGPVTVATLHHLLSLRTGAALPRPLLVRVHRASAGNPFYSLEIARAIQRGGEIHAAMQLPVPTDVTELALVRISSLPAPTIRTLERLSAMSRPGADDVDLDALAPAEHEGIARVRPSGLVEFVHPLFGSALYRSLSEARRREVHRELAGTARTPEEHAHHLALAGPMPDAAIAAALDEAARSAGARGAGELGVTLAGLACRATPPEDRSDLVRRRLYLADRLYFIGDSAAAHAELADLVASLPPGGDRADALLELGSVIWARGDQEHADELMNQALSEAATDRQRAGIYSRISALAEDCDIAVAAGRSALELLNEADDPVEYSFALQNLALWQLYAGAGADAEAVERGTVLQRGSASWSTSTVPAFWARAMDDFGTARTRFEDLLRGFAEQGDEASSCGVLGHLAALEAMTGHPERAAQRAREALDLAEQTDQYTYVTLALLADAELRLRTGDADGARRGADDVLTRLAEAPDLSFERRARAILGMSALVSGDLRAADRELTRADHINTVQHFREPAFDRYHGDHVEAVVGLGDLDRAEVLVERLEARATALPRPWICAVSARSRGLLEAARGDLAAAALAYERAEHAHAQLDMPAELARTKLVQGRLLRRRGERASAQAVLRDAVAGFERAGDRAWAAVSQRELDRAIGRRQPGSLSATERQVAELAIAGLRNQEIADRLVVSRKTVEANLSRVYGKLGVRSRTELAKALGSSQP